MNVLTDESKRDPEHLSISLASWYASHSDIRRAWAIETDSVLEVFVTLEPTFDGDDPLPTWLARNTTWTSELETLTRRQVHLQLISSGATLPRIDEAAQLSELSWRDAWTD